MKRLIISVFLACAGLTILGAQETTSPSKPDSTFEYEPIRKGDTFIRMGIGVGLPLFNVGPEGASTHTNINNGGTGSIGISKYVTSRLALGGEITFAFNSTIGNNLFFYLPISFKTSYELVFNRIRVPLSLSTGIAFQTYNGRQYFGPHLKPEVGVYWLYSPEWSFGMSSAWNIIPQWYKDTSNNRTGNMLDLVAGFRYHF